jgi:hypothetical protein
MRERKKVQNSMKSGAGADEVYVPAWFVSTFLSTHPFCASISFQLNA